MSGSLFVGRDDELKHLHGLAESAASGSGRLFFLGGKAGMGKTRLIKEFSESAQAHNFNILKGLCLPDSHVPLLPFREALRSGGLYHISLGGKSPRILQLYLIDDSGILLAQYSRSDEQLDSDIFAGMLTAVENFVKDSLSALKRESGGLKGMGYGDYSIVVEHGAVLNFVAIIEGQENEFLRRDMRDILQSIEEEHGDDVKKFYENTTHSVSLEEGIVSLVSSRKYDGIDYTGDDPRIKQENIFDNILLGLQRESQQNPLVVILEDMHWSDPTSLSLLGYLARNIAGSRIFILCTYRPEELVSTRKQRHHPLKSAIDALDKENLCSHLVLDGVDDAKKLVDGLIGENALTESFLEKINRDIDGNPFFIIEFIRLLQETGKLQPSENGNWILTVPEEEVDVPSHISDVLRHRLAMLHEEHVRILESASVVGDDFSGALVSSVSDVNRIKLLSSLSELEKTHKLVFSEGPMYQFNHAKIREVVYEDMPGDLRREYHMVLAETYEHMFPHDLENLAEKLATHYHKASDPRASGYGMMAGANYAREYANEEAITMYDIALESMENSDERRLLALEAKGDLKILAGDFAGSILCFNEILSTTNDNETKARCHRKISISKSRTGRFHEALKDAEAGLVLVPGKSLERGHILINIAYTFSLIGKYDEALLASREADEIFQEMAADKKYHVDAKKCEALTLVSLGEWKKADEMYKSLLDMIDEREEPWLAAATYNNMGQLQAYTGKLREARASFERSVELMDVVGDKRNLTLVTANYCWVLKELGQFSIASDILDGVIRNAISINDSWTLFLAYNNNMDVNIRQNNYRKAWEYFAKSIAVGEHVGENIEGIVLTYLKSYLLTSEGNAVEGEKEARKALAMAHKHKMQRVIGMAMYFLATALEKQGRYGEAKEVLNEALEAQKSERLERNRSLMHMGMITLKLNDETGLLDIRSALEEFEEMGAEWDICNARRELALWESKHLPE